jgi:hypothetical protein
MSRQAQAEREKQARVILGSAEAAIAGKFVEAAMTYADHPTNLTFLTNAGAAGIVLGARVPIILTSRADSVRTRMASCAVAVLYAMPGGGSRHCRWPELQWTAFLSSMPARRASNLSCLHSMAPPSSRARSKVKWTGSAPGPGYGRAGRMAKA